MLAKSMNYEINRIHKKLARGSVPYFGHITTQLVAAAHKTFRFGYFSCCSIPSRLLKPDATELHPGIWPSKRRRVLKVQFGYSGTETGYRCIGPPTQSPAWRSAPGLRCIVSKSCAGSGARDSTRLTKARATMTIRRDMWEELLLQPFGFRHDKKLQYLAGVRCWQFHCLVFSGGAD